MTATVKRHHHDVWREICACGDIYPAHRSGIFYGPKRDMDHKRGHYLQNRNGEPKDAYSAGLGGCR